MGIKNNLNNDTAIDVSIIIPAFNEAKRLPAFLEKLISYCNKRPEVYEVIIVDDGSNDGTYNIAATYWHNFSALQVIRVRKNRGKGYAVRRGLLHAKGRICLFLDADGSVAPEEIGRNLRYMDEGYDIFIGSRVLTGQGQVLKIKWYRKIVGVIFNFCVHVFLFEDIKDTQCGFKMFRKEVIKPLFSRSYLRGFGFDVEILYLAYKMGYPVKEGPVSWEHVRHSKVNLFLDSIVMFFDILRVRNWHCTPINTSVKYMGPDEYRYMFELENYHWWFVSRRNLILNLIRNLQIVYQPTILDLGAGTGGNILLLRSIGKAYGLDASGKAIEFCSKRGLKDVIQATAEHIAYRDRTFDIIICTDLLEHVADSIEVLREARRVLKDNGKIIITVPAFRILWSQHDEALCHLRRYTKESLAVDLQEADLKVNKIGYFLFISFFIVAPIRIARRFYIAKKIHSDTTTLPPKPLNKFLISLFKMELSVAGKVNIPFGTTLYTVVSK